MEDRRERLVMKYFSLFPINSVNIPKQIMDDLNDGEYSELYTHKTLTSSREQVITALNNRYKALKKRGQDGSV